jgi:DNA modification methylase
MRYEDFLESKTAKVEACGIEPGAVNSLLFGWQSDIVKWALRRGRAALFEDCGLGKTFQQVEWIRQSAAGARGLIVAPLSVAQQTIEEARKLGAEVVYKAEPDSTTGIWITNYQRLHKFVGAELAAIVLDESSILKSLDGKARTLLLEEFTSVPYRLCCTATPAPNDLTELANHAQFLGAMDRAEMLATFFVHDSERSGDDGWRLKGHAKEHFWRWVAQWAVYLRRPSDLGYPDGAFQLPALNIYQDVVESNFIPDGHLFPGLNGGIQGRTEARRKTIEARWQRASEIVQANGAQWLVWCGLNDEGRELAKALGDDCVLIEGATTDKKKVEFEQAWRVGQVKTLISKPSIFGFGLNWQHCHKVLYLGLDDSFEKWYQSVRRCWRFGQERDVDVVVVTSDAESQIVDNVRRKERQASELAQGIVDAMKDAQVENVLGGISKKEAYKVKTTTGEGWEMKLGDCVERIKEIETASVGLSVFSPPFAQLYTYSASERDLGNSKNYEQFFYHFDFLIPELLRVTKPGRRCCVHVQQVALTLVRDGVIGVKDFRADVVRAFVNRGWIYDNEVVIDKDPQAQAIRTKAKSLMFVTKNKDSAWSRPALADYILLFRAPGENAEPIKTDVSNEEWIEFARPIWYGIKESDTLNYQVARENEDERHICPLQLGTIERCVRLWSNAGDVVLSPFAGIGSEGHVGLQHGRRFIGIELKESYFNQAVKNLKAAVLQESLFTEVA